MKIKELEQEQIKQEHEITSLTNKNEQLEEELENAEDKIKELKGTGAEESDYKTELENSMRKISLLEQDLEDSEMSLKETTSK